MKYSFMSFSCPELDVPALVETARRHGYDGVEPRVEAKHAHGIELAADKAARAQVRQTFEAGGIEMACLATSCCYSDPAEREMQVDKTRGYIQLAADLGCSRLRVFGGCIKGGLTREGAVAHLAEALLAVADLAAANKVRVCLETHDDWCDPADVAAVMRRVDHAWIGVNWDAMHPVRTRHSTMADAFAALKPWIQHVHLHDCAAHGDNIVFTPIGQGIIDNRLALQLLTELGRDLFLSFEWFNMGPHEVHLPAGLAAMKAYEESLATKEIFR
jgi:sugar phosphate isomerase/epimerase